MAAKAVQVAQAAQEVPDWESIARTQAEQMLGVLKAMNDFLSRPTSDNTLVLNRLRTEMRVACEGVQAMPSTPKLPVPSGPPRQFSIFDFEGG